MDNLYLFVAIPADLIEESGIDLSLPVQMYTRDNQIVIENPDESVFSCHDDCDDLDGCRACRCRRCSYGDSPYHDDRKRGAR